MKKFLWVGVLFVASALAVIGFAYKDRIQRARMAASLFSGAEQYQNFGRLTEMFPYSTMPAATMPYTFPTGEKANLPEFFHFDDRQVAVETFLKETDSVALLVLKDGEIRTQEYWLTGGPQVRWLSMSVAKSFISALIGIAIDQGKITSVDEPITDYVPELRNSAYDGVIIKDILQMSSGARWNEDYSDSNSDINRFGRIFALGGSLDQFAASLQREREPGTVNHYNSIDTQVLGMLLVAATDQSITDYMIDHLWHPLGAESAAHWLIDSEEMEMAFGGLNATARDYAKLGQLYLQHGQWNGQQIVPAQWVQQSVTPDADYLQPRVGEDGIPRFGYGYQWWIPLGDEGEYTAIGVYNQFIYVNPTDGVVIVKLSANSDYGTSTDESSYRERETIEFFRAIVDRLKDSDLDVEVPQKESAQPIPAE